MNILRKIGVLVGLLSRVGRCPVNPSTSVRCIFLVESKGPLG
jgi:hypothetical protein